MLPVCQMSYLSLSHQCGYHNFLLQAELSFLSFLAHWIFCLPSPDFCTFGRNYSFYFQTKEVATERFGSLWEASIGLYPTPPLAFILYSKHACMSVCS